MVLPAGSVTVSLMLPPVPGVVKPVAPPVALAVQVTPVRPAGKVSPTVAPRDRRGAAVGDDDGVGDGRAGHDARLAVGLGDRQVGLGHDGVGVGGAVVAGVGSVTAGRRGHRGGVAQAAGGGRRRWCP